MDAQRGNNELLNTAVRITTLVFFVGTLAMCSFHDYQQCLLVCAPFLAVLVPGYLDLLPDGGVKHGTSCDCIEPDSRCEFGFWFEMFQKFSLLFPVFCSSVFLYYLVNFDLSRALQQTTLSIGLIAAYSVVFVLAICGLVSRR